MNTNGCYIAQHPPKQNPISGILLLGYLLMMYSLKCNTVSVFPSLIPHSTDINLLFDSHWKMKLYKNESTRKCHTEEFVYFSDGYSVFTRIHYISFDIFFIRSAPLSHQSPPLPPPKRTSEWGEKTLMNICWVIKL